MIPNGKQVTVALCTAVIVAFWNAPVHRDDAVAQERKGIPVLWMYGDSNGETHLKDIELDVSNFITLGGRKRDTPGTDAHTEPIKTPGVQFRRAGLGQNHGPREGDWRTGTPSRPGQYMIMLKGQLEVATTDGQKRVLGPGDILLEDDLYSKGHYSRAITANRQQLFIPLFESPGQTLQPPPR
jgi:hypothetical protein